MNYMRLDGTFGPRLIPRDRWTDQIDEVVRKLIAEHCSASHAATEINREFGTSFSRCAVMSRANRRELGQFHNIRQYPRSATPKKPRVYKHKTKPRKLVAEQISQAPLIDDQLIPLGQRCTLLQLNSRTCKWPVGDPTENDFFFCGAKPIEGKPYCACHCRRAFNHEAKNIRFKKVFAPKKAE
jgi:GcrA cell cycle regulator